MRFIIVFLFYSSFTVSQSAILNNGESGFGLRGDIGVSGFVSSAQTSFSGNLNYTHNAKFEINGGLYVSSIVLDGISFSFFGVNPFIGYNWTKQPQTSFGVISYLGSSLGGGISEDNLISLGTFSIYSRTYLYKRYDVSSSFIIQPFGGISGSLNAISITENIFGSTTSSSNVSGEVSGGLTTIFPSDSVVLFLSGQGGLSFTSISVNLGGGMIIKL